MILFPTLNLPQATANSLLQLQASVDGLPTYAERVTEGKRAFSEHNKKTNLIFKVVREKLYELAGKTWRCAYCEDSIGDEVEHVAPKDLYPASVFSWQNYVYSCGQCNGANKRNRWKVALANGSVVEITRKRKAPVVEPVAGSALFINPRSEDPMNFLQLDIAGGTFIFAPKPGISAPERLRAEYTRTLVGLNSRAGMVERRKQAYVFLRSALESYDREKGPGGDGAKRAQLEKTVREADHRTVWKEAQRQRASLPEFDLLFQRNPEALAW
jgi:uncharacterized protein (TIGR02646 family)